MLLIIAIALALIGFCRAMALDYGAFVWWALAIAVFLVQSGIWIAVVL